MLSSTFHVNAALKLAPILPQNWQEMRVVRTICSSTDDPYFSLVTILPFNGNSMTNGEGSCITLLRHGTQGEMSR